MNVFYFSSDLFASVVAVSMVSLLENNKEQEKITFYIVDDGISDEKKILLNNMVVQYESDNIKRRCCLFRGFGTRNIIKISI